MKIKKITILSLLIVLLSACNINLSGIKVTNKNEINENIESNDKYCENYDACKIETDDSVHVENYDIYNTYTAAYSKVSKVSVVVTGFNKNAANNNELELAGYQSGFIINRELVNASKYRYFVLTTSLTFENLSYYEVLLSDGSSYEASLKGSYSDVYYQLAIFTFETSKDITLANIVYDKEIKVGEELLAISSPSLSASLMNSMSKGVVSGLNRQVEVATNLYAMGFQFDAPTNVGSQGGAIFDENGNIYAMIAGKIFSSSTIYVESISIGNNLKDIKHIIDKISVGEKYEKPTVGVSVIDLSTLKLLSEPCYLYPLTSKVLDVEKVNAAQLQTKKDIPEDLFNGIYISSISLGSVAYNAGMYAGDVIVKVDDRDIFDNCSLAMYLYTLDKGTTITIYTYLNPTGYKVTL